MLKAKQTSEYVKGDYTDGEQYHLITEYDVVTTRGEKVGMIIEDHNTAKFRASHGPGYYQACTYKYDMTSLDEALTWVSSQPQKF